MTSGHHQGPVILESGETLQADLVIPALGATPHTSLLNGMAEACFDRIGRVVVDGWMRPAGLNSVFTPGPSLGVATAISALYSNAISGAVQAFALAHI